MITTPTIGVTVRFDGLYTDAPTWRAIGLRCHPYTNTAEGSYHDTSDRDRDRVLMLIETARDQLGSRATDEEVLRRAIALRYDLELARTLGTVGGTIRHQHAHVHRAPQIDRLLSPGGDAE